MLPFGSLCWFVVSEKTVSLERVTSSFATLGLNTRLLPRRIFPAAAFRSASGLLQGYTYDLPNDRTAVLEIVEQDPEANPLVRVIRRSLKGAMDPPLSVAELTLHRGIRRKTGLVANSETLETTVCDGLSHMEESVIQSVVARFLVDYRERLESIPYGAFRGAVRETILAHDGVSITPSGVYWVGPDAEAIIRKLQRVVTSTTTGFFDIVPMPDTPEQRLMLQRAIGLQVVSDAEGVIYEFDAWRKHHPDTPITLAIHRRLVRRYSDTVRRMERLVNSTGVTLSDKARTKLDLARQLIMDVAPTGGY